MELPWFVPVLHEAEELFALIFSLVFLRPPSKGSLHVKPKYRLSLLLTCKWFHKVVWDSWGDLRVPFSRLASSLDLFPAKKLKHLVIDHHHAEGPLFPSLSYLLQLFVGLESLEITGTASRIDLEATLGIISGLPALKKFGLLDFQFSSLSGKEEFQDALSSLSRLEDLSLVDSSIHLSETSQDTLFEVLEKSTNLQKLRLQFEYETDAFINFVGNGITALKNLTELRMPSSCIDHKAIRNFAKFPQLRKLQILSEHFQDAVGGLSVLQNLETFQICICRTRFPEVPHFLAPLSQVPSLTSLFLLGYNVPVNISDWGLGNLTQLQQLRFECRKPYDPKNFKELSNLRILKFGKVQPEMDHTFFKYCLKLPNLEKVIFRNFPVHLTTGIYYTRLNNLEKLEKIGFPSTRCILLGRALDELSEKDPEFAKLIPETSFHKGTVEEKLEYLDDLFWGEEKAELPNSENSEGIFPLLARIKTLYVFDEPASEGDKKLLKFLFPRLRVKYCPEKQEFFPDPEDAEVMYMA
jgi:hypothetical protein